MKTILRKLWCRIAHRRVHRWTCSTARGWRRVCVLCEYGFGKKRKTKYNGPVQWDGKAWRPLNPSA